MSHFQAVIKFSLPYAHTCTTTQRYKLSTQEYATHQTMTSTFQGQISNSHKNQWFWSLFLSFLLLCCARSSFNWLEMFFFFHQWAETLTKFNDFKFCTSRRVFTRVGRTTGDWTISEKSVHILFIITIGIPGYTLSVSPACFLWTAYLNFIADYLQCFKGNRTREVCWFRSFDRALHINRLFPNEWFVNVLFTITSI